MPVITVWGLPSSLDCVFLARLREMLRTAVAEIAELEITRQQVTVFFPSDLTGNAVGVEIVARVTELFDKPEGKPERTVEIKNRVAKAVRECLRINLEQHLRCLAMIEVPVYGFYPKFDGFDAWSKNK